MTRVSSSSVIEIARPGTTPAHEPCGEMRSTPPPEIDEPVRGARQRNDPVTERAPAMTAASSEADDHWKIEKLQPGTQCEPFQPKSYERPKLMPMLGNGRKRHVERALRSAAGRRRSSPAESRWRGGSESRIDVYGPCTYCRSTFASRAVVYPRSEYGVAARRVEDRLLVGEDVGRPARVVAEEERHRPAQAPRPGEVRFERVEVLRVGVVRPRAVDGRRERRAKRPVDERRGDEHLEPFCHTLCTCCRIRRERQNAAVLRDEAEVRRSRAR